MTKEKVYIRIPVSPQMYEEIRDLAEATSRTIPQYVRQVLRRFLECRGDAVEPRDYFQLGDLQ